MTHRMRPICRTHEKQQLRTVDEAVAADRKYFDNHPGEDEYIREFVPKEFGKRPEIPPGFRYATQRIGAGSGGDSGHNPLTQFPPPTRSHLYNADYAAANPVSANFTTSVTSSSLKWPRPLMVSIAAILCKYRSRLSTGRVLAPSITVLSCWLDRESMLTFDNVYRLE